MDILRRYRFLLVILGLVAVAALWEPPSRDEETGAPSSAEFEAKRRAADVLGQLYPDGDEVYYTIAVTQIKKGDFQGARENLERALETGVKTNEDNFYYYAAVLVAFDAPQEEIDAAVQQWRFHFPFSSRPVPTTLIRKRVENLIDERCCQRLPVIQSQCRTVFWPRRSKPAYVDFPLQRAAHSR